VTLHYRGAHGAAARRSGFSLPRRPERPNRRWRARRIPRWPRRGAPCYDL
jgi:hypothetical protein